MKNRNILCVESWQKSLATLVVLLLLQGCGIHKFRSVASEQGPVVTSSVTEPVEKDPEESKEPKTEVTIVETSITPTVTTSVVTSAYVDMIWIKKSNQYSAVFLESNGNKVDTLEFSGGEPPFKISQLGLTPNLVSLGSINVSSANTDLKSFALNLNTKMIFSIPSALVTIEDNRGKKLSASFNLSVVAAPIVGSISITGPSTVRVNECVQYTINAVKIISSLNHSTDGAVNCFNSEKNFYGMSWGSAGAKTYIVSGTEEGGNRVQSSISVSVTEASQTDVNGVTPTAPLDYFTGDSSCVIPLGSSSCSITLSWANSTTGPRIAFAAQVPRGLNTTNAGSYNFILGGRQSNVDITNQTTKIRSLSSVCENQGIKDEQGVCREKNDPLAGRCGVFPIWGNGSGFYINDNPNNTFVTITCYPPSANGVANKVGDTPTEIRAVGSGQVNNGFWYAGYGSAKVSCQFVETIPQWVISQSTCTRNP